MAEHIHKSVCMYYIHTDLCMWLFSIAGSRRERLELDTRSVESKKALKQRMKDWEYDEDPLEGLFKEH